MNPQNKWFVVSFVSFFGNEMKTVFVEAPSEFEACLLGYVEISNAGNDSTTIGEIQAWVKDVQNLEQLYTFFFNMDSVIQATEIPEEILHARRTES